MFKKLKTLRWAHQDGLLLKLWNNDFLIALLFLGVYLSTSPYIYGWDDQHLEIPILKHLIDPSMYKGDYYVESATKYFTCWLYPILSHLITVNQIPATYLVLFLISRCVMFYFVLRIWLFFSGSRFKAISATLMFLLLGRTDEFLYRSFCHEEFCFMFMFAGLYYFFKERYLLAALIYGIGVNFHAIYSLFPMLYMLAYLLLFHPERFKITLQTGLIYVAAALPFLCWQIPISVSRELAHHVPASEWLPLYLLSCPQNFLFGGTSLTDVFSSVTKYCQSFAPYLLFLGLYAFQLAVNPKFRQNKKIHTILGLSWALLAFVFIFDYLQPNRFVVDLNIQRVQQYMRFFLMGFTTIWACDQIPNSKPWLALAPAVLVLACGTTDLIALIFLGLVSLVFIVDASLHKHPKALHWIMGGGILISIAVLFFVLRKSPDWLVYWNKYYIGIIGLLAVFIAIIKQTNNLWLRRLLIIVPLLASFGMSVYHCFEYFDLKQNGPGPWQLLRDWDDMQNFVRENTPKDAVIMTPYDTPMGGFRIKSERRALVCYRDCGIIGFDYNAAVEWNKRINDIQHFKIYTSDRVDQDVLRAILKYKIDYVLFMKYYSPPGDNAVLKKIYDNEVFALFQVL